MKHQLYDEKGEYIGWEKGKKFYLNHGPHKDGLVALYNNPKHFVVCAECKLILTKEQISHLETIRSWQATLGYTFSEPNGDTFVSFLEDFTPQ